MNVSILIPQLFYDLIGRIIPGAALIVSAAMLFSKSTIDGVHLLTSWSDKTVFVIGGNLLASHIVGSLIGGVWFRIYRLDFLVDAKCKHTIEECDHSNLVKLLDKTVAALPIPAPIRFVHKWLIRKGQLLSGSKLVECDHTILVKWLHGWAKNGENRIDKAFNKTFEVVENMPILGHIKMRSMTSTGRVAFIYDYLQLYSPKACARIAKLRAEQHMSGVLMIGYLLLATIYYFVRHSLNHPWPLWTVEITLLFGALTAGWLAWHLEKRASTALYFSWLLLWSRKEKIDDPHETNFISQVKNSNASLSESRITINPDICHGKPTIRGLRYTVEMILELLSSGMTPEEILADYKDLEREDISAVLAFAARFVKVKSVKAALI